MGQPVCTPVSSDQSSGALWRTWWTVKCHHFWSCLGQNSQTPKDPDLWFSAECPVRDEREQCLCCLVKRTCRQRKGNWGRKTGGEAIEGTLLIVDLDCSWISYRNWDKGLLSRDLQRWLSQQFRFIFLQPCLDWDCRYQSSVDSYLLVLAKSDVFVYCSQLNWFCLKSHQALEKFSDWYLTVGQSRGQIITSQAGSESPSWSSLRFVSQLGSSVEASAFRGNHLRSLE